MAAAAPFLAGGNPLGGLVPNPDNQTFASIAGDPFKRVLALTAEAMLGSRLGDNTSLQ